MTTPSHSVSAGAGPSSLPALIGYCILLAALWWTAGWASGMRVPSMTPDGARLLLDGMDESRRTADHAAMLRDARRLLRAFPDRPEYLATEAEALHELGDFRGEAAAWEAYILVAPFPRDACPQLGRAYAEVREAGKALDAHRRCLSFDPGQPDLQLYLANALMQRGESREAEELYARILESHPGYGDALIALARLRMGQGRVEDARALLARVENAGSNPDALYAESVLLETSGDRKGAQVPLRQAIRVSPAYADLYKRLARLLMEDGDKAAALEVYESLLQVAPDDEEALRRSRTLEQALKRRR